MVTCTVVITWNLLDARRVCGRGRLGVGRSHVRGSPGASVTTPALSLLRALFLKFVFTFTKITYPRWHFLPLSVLTGGFHGVHKVGGLHLRSLVLTVPEDSMALKTRPLTGDPRGKSYV